MNTHIDVSIILVNYNKCQMTQECIDSIFAKTQDLAFEVILVDNASTDDSKEHFEQDSRIRYIYSYENMGFGRANNVGMMLAKGEYVFLLNNDTYLQNNAVKQFYDYAEQHERTAFYGGWLLNAQGENVHSGGKMTTIGTELHIASLAWTTRLPILRNSAHATQNNDAVRHGCECLEVGYVTGADLFLHRSVIERCGWFDHRFFMYYEETDWQKRGKAMGIKSYLIEGPQIVHLQDFEKVPTVGGMLLRFASTNLFVKKHDGYIGYVGYRVANFALRFLPLLFNGKYTWRERCRMIKAIVC